MFEALPTIKCLYSCEGCGIERAEVEVPIRTTQDVAEWMERVVIYIVSGHHAAHSPECTAQTMRDVMIPITGADKIGGSSLQ